MDAKRNSGRIDESFQEKETSRLREMPFASGEWHLTLRLSDGTVDRVPLVPEGDFVVTAPRNGTRWRGGSWTQTVRYSADVSGHEGFQGDYRHWHDLIAHALGATGTEALRPVDSIRIALNREFDSHLGLWGPWEAVLDVDCLSWLGKPVIARADPDACDSDPSEVLSRLGVLDGESLARLVWSGDYEWSPETQTWVNTTDTKPWWESVPEWLSEEDALLFGSVDSWILSETDHEDGDGKEGRIRRIASRYSDCEDALDGLPGRGGTTIGATVRLPRGNGDKGRQDVP